LREENSVVIKTPKKKLHDVGFDRLNQRHDKNFAVLMTLENFSCTSRPLRASRPCMGKLKFALQIATKKPEISSGYHSEQIKTTSRLRQHFILTAALCIQSGGSISQAEILWGANSLTAPGGSGKMLPASRTSLGVLPPSSRGPGRSPFKAKTRVRISVGAHKYEGCKVIASSQEGS
jgi:hypothetical protein